MSLLLEPFTYAYMSNAIWVSSLVGLICAFLSCFLMLKGWSLIGDALSHAIVPGVAVAYFVGLPFALGAFVAGGLAAGSMLLLNQRTGLKIDAIIGLIFTSFFGLGLFIVSLRPAAVDLQSITLGNILAITPGDTLQLLGIAAITLAVLVVKWRDLVLIFFDEAQARALGLRVGLWKLVFFALLSASCVAALQTVGAFLVIAMIITPGATAYLLFDRFGHMLMASCGIGAVSCFLGAYLSYFLNGATGALIIVLQTLVFLLVFVFAPQHGLLAQRRRRFAKAVTHG